MKGMMNRMKKKEPLQGDMFTGQMVGADTSLFSGTAMHVQDEQFNPPSEVFRMDNMFGCPVCYGTGWIKANKKKAPTRCTCEAGEQAGTPHFPEEADQLRTLATELHELYHIDPDILDILHTIADRIE